MMDAEFKFLTGKRETGSKYHKRKMTVKTVRTKLMVKLRNFNSKMMRSRYESIFASKSIISRS